ncbi:stage II sporulation protein P [Paenibacillus sp. BC26]|uniref:stage II sporulation protein P n=1 Tax=Paenibacillus sp. BC26 TaxID=1881032 RepID=UPI0008E0D2A5|nr:stage II sporulation protein P [Paenibacillus sp. BC26]SFS77566.1 stage II sporulation protein P [Paenibacillus sp. BC26]
MIWKDEEFIINTLKNSPIMIPSVEFVNQTRQELQHRAQILSKKEIMLTKYLLGSGVVAALMIVAWLTFLSGSHQLNTAINAGINLITSRPSITANTNTEPVVFIYHTHNLESFKPDLGSSLTGKTVESRDINITLVGKHLSEKLEELGVKTLVDQTDYTIKPNFDFSGSYQLSRKTVSSALKTNPSLKMVFDVHRDSLTRGKTTTQIDDKDLATIHFVIASSNENYQENLRLAQKIKKGIEKLYPSLSPQITLKKPEGDTGQSYNQDLFDDSLLIEIGGIENSLQEEYRAADILAQAISNIIH